ncbi:MAG: thiamine phosphate synthase [Legionellaceae bacterium]|nr:thiamine phosphate synthase [Legionellaceae bacterium]
MTNPYRLYLITNRQSLKHHSLIEVVEAAVSAGVHCVQLREKYCSTYDFIELGRALKTLLTTYHVPLFINDRVDVALAVNADGVHLGNADMSYVEARQLIGHTKHIGLTINHPEQINRFNHYQLAYLGVSAVFKSSVKKNIERIWTASEIQQLKAHSKHLLIGIGGITPCNTKQILSYGLDGIAVASALCGQPNLAAVKNQTKQFINALSQS